MKRLFLIVNLFLLALGSSASAVEDQAKYDAYRQRRADRRTYALATRRAMNAGKVHVYRTAVVVHVNPMFPMGPPAIQQGLIKQPPIVVATDPFTDLLSELVSLSYSY